jgi:peptidyl-prolyl cis-trans isomerase D
VRPGTRRTFEEAKQELADEARSRGAQDRFFALTEKMDDAALENPSSLEPVAAATGLPIQRIDPFTRDGGGAFGANRAVIDAAFSAAVIEGGENSPLVEVGEGRAVVLRVSEHRPVKLRPLEEVRADVEKALRREKAARLAAEQGGQILELARAGSDLGKLAAEAGTSLQGPQPLARNSPQVPPELLETIFRAPRPVDGKPVLGGMQLESGGYAVYRLEEVMPANPEDVPREQRDMRKNLLARQSGVAETTALAVDLRNDAEVVITPNLFEQQDSL